LPTLLAEIGLTRHLFLDDAAMLVRVLDDDEPAGIGGDGRAGETENESSGKGALRAT
jgi:hypothetical protein